MARLIYPQTLGLIHTNVAASTLDEWSSAGVSYTTGDQVKYTTGQDLPHHTYEATADHVSSASNAPAIGGTTQWLDLGAVNQHAMFDGLNNNRTVADASENIEVYVVPPGRARYLYLTGLRNAASITVSECTVDYWSDASVSHSIGDSVLYTDGTTPPHVYDALTNHTSAAGNAPAVGGTTDWSDLGELSGVSAALQSTTSVDLLKSRNPVGAWAWLLDIEGDDRYYARSVAIRLPGSYYSPTLFIRIASTATEAECAQTLVGLGFELGQTEWEAESELKDFSTFEQNDFGVTTFVPRQNTRKLRGTIWAESTQYERIYSLFEDRISQLVLLDLNNNDTGDYSLDPLRAYGKVDSLSGGIQYNKTPINITLLGLE